MLIITQPDKDYFIWQLKVQMMNFREFGLEEETVILLAHNGEINPNAKLFAKETKARVMFYEDTRGQFKYYPSVIPHLFAKYFSHYNAESFMYLGDDCLFVNKPELPKEKKVYLASCNSLNSKYLKSKSEKAFYTMCNIAGIDPEIVEFNDPNCGGAQHFFNIVPDADYWREAEVVGNKLFDYLTLYNQTAEKRIQAWTAGMWAILWGLWKRGVETEVCKELNHSWPSYPIERLKDFNFFHNSGVTEKSSADLFFKGAYRKEAPKDLSYVSREFCSGWYADQIIKAL